MAKHIRITGSVHGVGFRPFVYGLATRLDLHGWVCNTSEGVEIYIEGSPSNEEYFIQGLTAEKPARSRIDSLVVQAEASRRDYQTFDILPSLDADDRSQPLSADLSICPDCERELFDPRSRRYLYPFTSCAQCGPRFSVITDIPYQRSNTTMAEFGMCENCGQEYQDPQDRRYQAHLIACPECGPFVALREIHTQFPYVGLKISSIECRTSAVLKARRLLREGYILGIKGPGGFHLACDASNTLTVEELRDRKGHIDKPFALMAASMEVVRSICHVSREEEELLTSREKPIVLLEKQAHGSPGYNVSRWVAPNIDTLGVMLPYSALHHLLLNQTDLLLGTEPVPPLLVMTSGSLADEPIATDDEDALLRLSPLVDAFLLDNREIHMRCDDSVVRVAPGSPERENRVHRPSSTVYLRRSRGYAPYSIKLPFEVKPTLAVGSEYKNTFCLARDRVAYISHHIGNMENVQTYESFEQSVLHLSRIYQVQPQIIAHGLSQNYFTTQYVRRSPLAASRVGVQHHHAHIASCMADNGLTDRRLIGLSFDGTAYGTDGAIWGGEVLLASYSDFERYAHLEYLPLPTGEAARRTPWRIAVGYAHILGLEVADLPFIQQMERQPLENLRQQLDAGSGIPVTSCMAILFEAVAGLIGVRNENTYKAQAISELEVLARPFVHSVQSYPFEIESTDGGTLIRIKELLAAIIQDVRARRSTEMIAARFHKTVAQVALEICKQARRTTGLNEVALSGELWQNQILMDVVRKGLKHEGFTVYSHRQVPANDSGISLGQVVIANHCADHNETVSPPGFAPISKDHQPSGEKVEQ